MATIIDGLQARLKIDATCALLTARIITTDKEDYAPKFLTCFISQRLVTHKELAFIKQQERPHTVLRVLKHDKWAALVQFFIGNLSDDFVMAMFVSMKNFVRLTPIAIEKMKKRLDRDIK